VLSENWEVTFPLKNGTLTKKTYKTLNSWSEASEEEIQHFSGTAIYEKNFNLSKKQVSKDNALELDLGSVGIMAEVIVNNLKVATLWKAPYRVDITDYVKKGTNNLKIKITNLWVNRLIGDENLSLDYERNGEKMKSIPDWLLNNTKRPSKRTTFASWKHWDKNDNLLVSGLLGPVKINVLVVKKLK